jgi:phosphoribosylglycinamide formyltransferase 1
MPQARIAVLASGNGTLLHAMIEAGVGVALVVADRPCRALEIATEHGIDAEFVERTEWGSAFDRAGYSERLVKALRAHHIDLVVMAGFGTVVPGLPAAYPGRVLNTHPALLPAFKGWHAVRDALAAGVKVTGTTVHIATAEVDTGPILAQEAVPVLPDDTEESLHERIKQVERRLYPATIRRFLADVDDTDAVDTDTDTADTVTADGGHGEAHDSGTPGAGTADDQENRT